MLKLMTIGLGLMLGAAAAVAGPLDDCNKLGSGNLPDLSRAKDEKSAQAIMDQFYDTVIRGCTTVIRSGQLGQKPGVPYFNRGGAFYGKNLPDRAIEDFTKAIELGGAGNDQGYRSRGKAYRDMGQLDLAVRDLTKAIEINPQAGTSYRERGKAYALKNAHDQAIQDFTKAIEIRQQDAEAYHARGKAYLATDQLDRAIQDFRTAVQFDRQNDLFNDDLLSAMATKVKKSKERFERFKQKS